MNKEQEAIKNDYILKNNPSEIMEIKNIIFEIENSVKKRLNHEIIF